MTEDIPKFITSVGQISRIACAEHCNEFGAHVQSVIAAIEKITKVIEEEFINTFANTMGFKPASRTVSLKDMESLQAQVSAEAKTMSEHGVYVNVYCSRLTGVINDLMGAINKKKELQDGLGNRQKELDASKWQLGRIPKYVAGWAALIDALKDDATAVAPASKTQVACSGAV